MNICIIECVFIESDFVVFWLKFYRGEIMDNKFFIIFGIIKFFNILKC